MKIFYHHFLGLLIVLNGFCQYRQLHQSLQEVEKLYRGRLLNVNELRTVVSLLEAVAGDPKMQPTLEKLRARGEISIVGLSGMLEPLHHAIHAHTAPRTLLQR